MDPTLFEYLVHQPHSTFNDRKDNSKLYTAPDLSTSPQRGGFGGYASSPPTSSGKKKKKFGFNRDSQQSRMKLGRPGSRRYRHWENEFFLVKNLSETESSCSSGDESLAPAYGAFAFVFQNSTNRQILEPFLDITEEQQEILLGISAFDRANESDEDVYGEVEEALSPSGIFGRLPRRSQRTLRKHSDNSMVQQLDDLIFSFSKGDFSHPWISLDRPYSPTSYPSDSETPPSSPSSPSYLPYLRSPDSLSPSPITQHTAPQDSDKTKYLVFSFEEKFHRHILHALCEFYDLVSYSVNTEQERLTIVRQKARKIPIQWDLNTVTSSSSSSTIQQDCRSPLMEFLRENCKE